MEVFRIVKAEFSGTLFTSGRANRWNRKGQHVLYASTSRALATLEQLVHLGSVRPDADWRVMVISLPDNESFHSSLYPCDLPPDWRKLSAYADCQRLGSDWADRRTSLILHLPSAVVPMERNVMINADHPDFLEQVKLVRTEPYFFDAR
ncbi:MAG: RES family NAD+ phosphorylase [Chitinophagaceae bacterium]|nr:RES family NAD+ phosphorylase [Chitinophagaceae bacterium]